MTIIDGLAELSAEECFLMFSRVAQLSLTAIDIDGP